MSSPTKAAARHGQVERGSSAENERTHAVLTRFLSVDTVDPSFNQEDLFINVRKEGDSEFSINDSALTGG